MNQPNKVKTRMTWQHGLHEVLSLPHGLPIEDESFRLGWEKALDSVMPPEGKRFDIGDRLVAYHPAYGDYSQKGLVIVRLDDGTLLDPAKNQFEFRPIRQTRELTAEEKMTQVVNKVFDFVSKDRMLPHDTLLVDTWAIVARALANGKTLDQLCEEYGIPLMKELE